MLLYICMSLSELQCGKLLNSKLIPSPQQTIHSHLIAMTLQQHVEAGLTTHTGSKLDIDALKCIHVLVHDII